MARLIWFCIGSAALVLGAIGAVLPLLPTTPLVILAAFAFGKSSPRVEEWLLSNPVFGPMIEDWRQNGAIALRYKILAVGMMAAVFALSIAMSLGPIVLTLQGICLLGAASFILTRPDGPRG